MRNSAIASDATVREDEIAGYTTTVNELMAMLRSGVDYLGPTEADGEFHIEVAEVVALLEGLHAELQQQTQNAKGASGPNAPGGSDNHESTEHENLRSQLSEARSEIEALRAALLRFKELETANQDTIVGLEERLADSQAAVAAAHKQQTSGKAYRPSSLSPGAASDARLVMRYPGRDVIEMPLLGDLRIGRSEPSEIRVGGQTVSRLHAILKWDGMTATIVDCNSTNGVYVNGSRVHEQKLHDGDEFRVGSLHCIFRSPSAG